MPGIDVESISGLSDEQALLIRTQEGFNELPFTKKRSIPRILFGVVREPMFVLLVASGLVYIILGDLREALMLLSFVFVIIGITVYQEQRTERALEALRDLSSPRALVIRGGEQKRIPGREVVTGDTLILSEGDRVSADAELFAVNNLTVDESLLTGESVPVRKIPGERGRAGERPGGDDQPMVYSGTLVVQGQGVATVIATGTRTEMGKIGTLLTAVDREDTPLKKDISRLVRDIALVALLLCSLIVVVYGITRLDWIGGLLAGITLAMALLPEEFPVVLTVFLALGAWRISREKVLTRQVPAVESLGSVSVLCVDKTGTLTLNRMTVQKFLVHGEMYSYNPSRPIPESCHGVVEFSILASKQDPFDPMEKALRGLTRDLAGTEHIHKNWTLVQEYPLSPALLAMSNVWQSPEEKNYVVAAKGAPEAIADLCHFEKEMRQDLERDVDRLAAEGLRVLGVARGTIQKTNIPDIQHDISFCFLGLVGLADPIRPKVTDAVQECYSAGIRVIMITGDYPLTAQAIARQIGLKNADRCIIGTELNSLSDEDLRTRSREVNVFARVVPEQKLRIVQLLKDCGEVVAMTGDGVNDAPALKAADIGIAMGGRGTDVAREAASLVLLDDNFTSIVAAIKLGRRIFDNLKKAVAYIFSIHVPIAGMSLFPVLFGFPLILLPVHIVFLELIIDPSCSIVFESEPEESDIMKRPPKRAKEGLFSRQIIALSMLQGAVVLTVVLIVYLAATMQGLGETESRALAFISIVIANLGLIFTNRSWSETILHTVRRTNRALWVVVVGTLLFLGVVLLIPPLQDLFRFSPLGTIELMLSFTAGVVSVLWFEIFKWFNLRHRQAGSKNGDELKK
jgi:Ca2+-transporting ATPase